jgi:hypothetical protein
LKKRASDTAIRKLEEKREEEGSENKCKIEETEEKQEKRKVPGSAIRRLVEVLERRGDENGCMLKEELLGLYEEVFGYKSEKPLYGVINRAIKRGRVYTIETREGVMICSRGVHERKLLSLLEDIYLTSLYRSRWLGLSERPFVKKFEAKIPDVDRGTYLVYAIQHLLCYEAISSIIKPDYRLVFNIIRLNDVRLLGEAKIKLSLRDLREAVQFYDDAIWKMLTLKARALASEPELVMDLTHRLRETFWRLRDVDVSYFEQVVGVEAERIKNMCRLSAEKLPIIVTVLRELYYLLGDVFTFLIEIENKHSRRYEELRIATFKVIEEVLRNGELKGECSLCGKPTHDDVELDILKSILDIYILPFHASRITSY